MHRLLLFILFVLSLVGCKKLELQTVDSIIDLPVSGTIRSIQKYNSTYVICGGKKESDGFILTTTDFSEFTIVVENFHESIYSSALYKGKYYFGCSNVEILLSDNLQEIYPYYYQEQYWINNQHKQPIKAFCVSDNDLTAVAGGDLRFGVLMPFNDTIQQFIPTEFDNEIRTLAYHPITKQTLAVGNGIALANSSHAPWQRLQSAPDYFTSLALFGNDLVGTTLQGKINTLTIEDNALIISNRNNLLQSGEFLNFLTSANNYLVGVGTNGTLMLNTDGNYQIKKLNTDYDLHSAVLVENQIYIGENGRLLIVDL